MQNTTITTQKAIEEQNRQLHTAKVAIDRVQDELITNLTAVALGEPDNGRAAELRNYLLVHQQTLEETPQVLTRLFIQEAALQEQAAADDRLAARQENDRLFFDLLNRIIAAGTASPAEIATMCQYAGRSSNPSRRCEMDRLIEALEDHARQVSAAKGWNRELPTFSFKLEEEGGERRVSN